MNCNEFQKNSAITHKELPVSIFFSLYYRLIKFDTLDMCHYFGYSIFFCQSRQIDILYADNYGICNSQLKELHYWSDHSKCNIQNPLEAKYFNLMKKWFGDLEEPYWYLLKKGKVTKLVDLNTVFVYFSID